MFDVLYVIYIYVHPLNQVILACVRGSQGHPRLSHRVLKRAILQFYSQQRLFPAGVVAELDAVQQWATKNGKALKRLAPLHGMNVMFYYLSLLAPSPKSVMISFPFLTISNYSSMYTDLLFPSC